MKPILVNLWFDGKAKQAADLYKQVFGNSKINNVTTLHGTPSGDANILSMMIEDLELMMIDGGPLFVINPAVSFYVQFERLDEIESAWKLLMDGGEVLMPYDTYPWARRYGWLKDKFGVTWQLTWSDEANKPKQKITPFLMFTQDAAGKAREAMEMYTAIFPNSKIEMAVEYAKEDGEGEGFVKHARFVLNGQEFMALDSSAPHQFTFNEAVSLIVKCKDQAEVDYFWEKLSAVPGAEQCGWLKDKFGVSWQIVPEIMEEMMSKGSPEQMSRVTKAFLQMKKFNIDVLKKAFDG